MKVKPCTFRLPVDLHNKLRAIVDVIGYPLHKETHTSIVMSGIEQRIAEICRDHPELRELMERRLEEMR